jgi:glycerol uptake facilitator protein
MENNQASLAKRCAAEGIGTAILIFFGLGAVHSAVLTGSYSGVLQVGLMWGIGVMAAAYAVGDISGAHLNPVVTAALAVARAFPRREVPFYWASQLVGAAVGAGILFLIFANTIAAYESREGIVRGEPKSVVTASMYGEYFPNPTVAIHGSAEAGYANLSLPGAVIAEIVGTAILVLVVLAVTEKRNAGAPGGNLAPLFIGLTVAAVIAVIGPLTQSCLNPARDFGPRLLAACLGWGSVAFPGPRGLGATLLVYLAAPLVGGVVAATLHRRWLRCEQC